MLRDSFTWLLVMKEAMAFLKTLLRPLNGIARQQTRDMYMPKVR